ncbi:hypothetical protein LTR17_024858 [Elasticomyces elasticus]|nr:hypothetical protein LTR17_024858 [Elasticomyces elasticus]
MALHEEKSLKFCQLLAGPELKRLEAEFKATGSDNVAPFAAPSYPYTSKAPLPTCPGTCTICEQQYLPYMTRKAPWLRHVMKMHSDAEAQSLAQQLVTATTKNLDAVREALEAHGDALLKRWVRKSVEKRAVIVRKAIPEAYGRDFARVRMEFEEQRVISGAIPKSAASMTLDDTSKVHNALVDNAHPDQFHNVNIVPYLDVQTLSEDPSNLLSILHHRSRLTPAEWALFDFEHTGIAFNRIMVYNPHCVIMYGKHYGKLIAWNKDSAHRLDICGYPRAMLVLKAQSILAKSLRSILDLIFATRLEDAANGKKQWDLLASSDFQYWQASGTLSRRLSAYRSPPSYDITAIVDVLNERLEAMTDELTQFQVDPLLFRAHLSQFHGTAFLDKDSEDIQTKATISTTLGCFRWQLNFRTAVAHAQFVRLEQAEHAKQVRAGRSSPEQYDAALVLLRQFLAKLFQGQLADLRTLQNYCKKFQQHQTYVKGTTRIHMSDGELYKDHLLLWNLKNIRNSSEFSAAPSYHLEWINKLISGRAGVDSEQVDDVIAMHVANMTAVDDVLSTFQNHRPQPEAADDSDVLRSLRQRLYGFEKEPPDPPGMWSALQSVYPQQDRIWLALKDFLALPLPSAKISSTSLNRHRALRSALEHFWDTVADVLINTGDIGMQGALPADIIVGHRNTQEYKEHAAEEDRQLELAVKSLEEERARNTLAKGAEARPSSLHFAQQAQVDQRTSRVEPKFKPKTRPADSIPKLGDEVTAQLAAVELPKIFVKSKSVELFDRMFTASVAESSDINWEELVAAMVDAGCAATPNGGSAVTFRQCSGGKSVIGFHRPHDSNVNPVMLKAMGRRLRKRFDWDAETFVTREKEDGKEGDANDA